MPDQESPLHTRIVAEQDLELGRNMSRITSAVVAVSQMRSLLVVDNQVQCQFGADGDTYVDGKMVNSMYARIVNGAGDTIYEGRSFYLHGAIQALAHQLPEADSADWWHYSYVEPVDC